MLSFLRRDPILISILFLALVLWLAYALQASSTPLAEVLLLDSDFYDRQARSLLAGKGWTEGVFFMNPLYPYLLAFLYWIGGPKWGIAAGVQVLMGAVNCWLIYALGVKVWDRQVGLAGVAPLALAAWEQLLGQLPGDAVLQAKVDSLKAKGGRGD